MVNGETLSIFISALPQDIEYSALLLFFLSIAFNIYNIRKLGVKGINCSKS